jgi:hypothetical protein
MEEVSIKGQPVISFLKFIDQELPPDKRMSLIERLPPRFRDEIGRRMILATSTYPVSLLNLMTIEGAKLAGVPELDFARRAGRFAAKEGLNGVYRVFVRILDTNTVLSKATGLWSTIWTAGKMSAERTSDHSAIVRLRGFPRTERVLCERISGWIEHIAEMTGAKPSVEHTHCTNDGAGECEWRLSW